MSKKFTLLLMSVVLGLLAGGCIGGSNQTPLPTIGPCRDCVSPSLPDSTAGFYLRVWQSQAVLPQYTFGWLPSETISDGQFIDCMIAIPTIYPGPIYEGLSRRAISAGGIEAIIAEARADGLLTGKTDFTAVPVPGSVTAHISLNINGTSYELSGPLPRSTPESIVTSGTTGAFEAFLARLQGLPTWLGADLGPSVPYDPTRVAFELSPPTDVSGPMNPTQVRWPLAGDFATFGVAYGGTDRCAVLSGEDLTTLLPIVQNANQLTRFIDSSGIQMSLVARVLLPGEPNVC